MAIQIKNLEQLKSMRKAGLVVAHTLNLIRDSAEIGMTTVDLDLLAVRSLDKYGATSSFKGYHVSNLCICE
jgi:methionyl aminopeptidase